MSQTYAVRKQCGGGTRLSFANCGSDCRRFISPLRSINENRRESARSQEVQHLHGPLPETGSVKTKLWSLVIFFIWYVGWWVPSNGPCCRQKVMIPFQPVRGSPPEQLDSDCTACSITAAFVLQLSKNYPLVNVQKTMESHHVQWEFWHNQRVPKMGGGFLFTSFNQAKPGWLTGDQDQTTHPTMGD